MKIKILSLCIFSLGLFLIVGCGASKSIAGEWSYKVTDLPDGDTTGTFKLMKDGKMYTGIIESEMGTADLTGVQVEDNKLKCSFSIPQAEVDMEGVFEGDNFKGTISAGGMDFPVTAEKVKKK